jgi:hypothetical protein
VRITLQLPADEAALVMKAIDVSAEFLSTGATSTTSPTSKTANATDMPRRARRLDRADGIVAMADQILRGALSATNAEPAPNEARALPKNPSEILVQIDANTLTGSLEDGSGLAPETAKRLLCDAGIVPCCEDEHGHILDIGRKTRTIPAAIRRALMRRDGGCRFPGCQNHRFVDGHHLHHWTRGGETRLDNLVLLCRKHHRAVHELGFSVELSETSAALRFFQPDGRPLPNVAERTPPRSPGIPHLCKQRDHRHIQAFTAMPTWDGSPLDHDRLDRSVVALQAGHAVSTPSDLRQAGLGTTKAA